MSLSLNKIKSLPPADVYPHLVSKFLGIPVQYVEPTFINALLFRDSVDHQLSKNTLSVTCKKGCAGCCFLNVDTFLHERLLILPNILLFAEDHWESLNVRIREWGKQFISVMVKHKLNGFENDLIKRKALIEIYEQSSLPCPFLNDNSCLIYEVRPVACRTYFSSSDPVLCGPNHQRKAPFLTIDTKNRSFSHLESFDTEFFRKPMVQPLGYYFFRRLSDIEKIKDAMKEYTQSIPIEQRQVCTPPKYDNLPIFLDKNYPFWPMCNFFERCFDRVEAMRREASRRNF